MPLYFCHVISIFFLAFFFSSPNLSGRRFDVCHASTHGVALVRIYDAGLKRAARGTLKIQDAKKSPKIRHMSIHRRNTSGYFFATKAVIDNRKNLLNSNISPHRPQRHYNKFRAGLVLIPLSTDPDGVRTVPGGF